MTARRRCTVLLLLLAAAPPLAARGQLEILIDKGVEKPLPIAVVPFSWSGAADAPPPQEPHRIIVANLERSGRFTAMDERDMPQQPADYQAVNFKDWQLLRMESIVIGKLRQTAAAEFEVEFRLLDVYKEKQLAGFRLNVAEANLRRAAHRASDVIFEKLTGARSAFDTLIAYVAVKQDAAGRSRYALRVVDEDGFNPRTLLESPAPLLSPAWSPDGRRLAYVSFEERRSAVFVQDLYARKRKKAAAYDGINGAPAWSPDGRRLALALSREGNPEIFVLDLAADALRRITNHPAIDTEPDFSPDGEKLLFTSDRDGSPQVYEVRLAGGKPQRITFDGTYFARPRYSPDGAAVALVYGEDRAYRVGCLDRDSGRLRVLTDNRLDEAPDFSPDGNHIIYAAAGPGGSELHVVSVDGVRRRRAPLPDDGEAREPAWGPFRSW